MADADGTCASSAGETPALPAKAAAAQLQQARDLHTVGRNIRRAVQEGATFVTEEEARYFLSEAARVTHEVIRMTREALAQVPLQRLNEAC
jgi:hypothetical protein